jgi:5-methylcytosine-specific restriction endonuclease McrA
MINPIPKTVTIRLKGKALAILNDHIWELDKRRCVLCWLIDKVFTPIPRGTKFHHIVFKSHGGGDTVNNGAMLCLTGKNCHGMRGHGPDARKFRRILLEYVETRGD